MRPVGCPQATGYNCNAAHGGVSGAGCAVGGALVPSVTMPPGVQQHPSTGFPFGQNTGMPEFSHGLPPPPKRQTDNLPSPASVEQQKHAYARALEAQLEAGKRTISEQTTQAKGILSQAAEEKKLQYAMQIDEQLMQQELSLDQQTHQQVMQLHQAAFQQKAQLEQQASNLTMEYKQRQMQEVMQQKQYEMQNRQYEMRMRMQQQLADRMSLQMEQDMQQGCMGQSPVQPCGRPNDHGQPYLDQYQTAYGGQGPAAGACYDGGRSHRPPHAHNGA